MITQARLKEVLHYEPVTGVFTWRARDPETEVGEPFRTKRWNARYAGTPAGSVHPDSGVVRIGIDGRIYIAHRLAYLYMTGVIPPVVLQHDNNPTNTCWDNLHSATWRQLRTFAA